MGLLVANFHVIMEIIQALLDMEIDKQESKKNTDGFYSCIIFFHFLLK